MAPKNQFIVLSELQIDNSSLATITNAAEISSYNWVDGPDPTILVPGLPPLWSPTAGTSVSIEPDSGTVTIDQDTARNRRSPSEPLLRSILAQDPSFDSSCVDFISSRNTIRKLFNFCKSAKQKHFRFQVEIIGQRTALFTRIDHKAKESIKTFKGYGHNFEKRFTKKLEQTTGHHRVIRYEFAGLRAIIRCEADAFVCLDSASAPDLGGFAHTMEQSQSFMSPDRKKSKKSKRSQDRRQSCAVTKYGESVPLSSILELKTVSIHTKPDWNAINCQLWASQTPNLVLARHEHGTFLEPVVTDHSSQIREWEQKNQQTIRRLAAVIARIIEIAKNLNAVDDQPVSLVRFEGGERLIVSAHERIFSLPIEIHDALNNPR